MLAGNRSVTRRNGISPDGPIYVDVQDGIKLRVLTPRELRAHDFARRESSRQAYGKRSGSRLSGRYAAIGFRLGVRSCASDLMRPRTTTSNGEHADKHKQVLRSVGGVSRANDTPDHVCPVADCAISVNLHGCFNQSKSVYGACRRE